MQPSILHSRATLAQRDARRSPRQRPFDQRSLKAHQAAVGARLLVSGAVSVARLLGMSELLIGLTIVALGTSLPELAASVMAAKKGEHDIAIGNVVGSNMFNLLAVVGIATVIAPIPSIPAEVLERDWLVMFALTFVFLAMAYGLNSKNPEINRFKGWILLLVYIGYNSYLGISVAGV